MCFKLIKLKVINIEYFLYPFDKSSKHRSTSRASNASSQASHHHNRKHKFKFRFEPNKSSLTKIVIRGAAEQSASETHSINETFTSHSRNFSVAAAPPPINEDTQFANFSQASLIGSRIGIEESEPSHSQNLPVMTKQQQQVSKHRFIFIFMKIYCLMKLSLFD